MRAVNLIPTEQRERAPPSAPGRSGGRRLRGARTAGRRGVAGGALRQSEPRSVQQEEPKRRRSPPRRSSAQAQANELAPYTSFVALHEQRAKAVATLVDSRFDWAHAIHEFGRVLTGQTSLTSLDGTIASGTGSGSGSGAASSDQRQLGDAARQRADLQHDRLRDQPEDGCPDAPAPAPDRRGQRSHPAELHQGQRIRGRRRREQRGRRLPGRISVIRCLGDLPGPADRRERGCRDDRVQQRGIGR